MSDALSIQFSDPSIFKKEVVFVDTSVADYKTLKAGVAPGMEVVEIDPGQSGLAQIAEWAETHGGYDAIHILSHGNEATLFLGSDALTSDKLLSAAVRGELAKLGSALKPGGDLLLYGCNMAAGVDGQQFIASLAAAAGVDVAASTDETGAVDKGGDWSLEAQTGSIDTHALQITDFQGVLVNVAFSSSDLDMGFGFTSVNRTVSGTAITFTGGAAAGGLGTNTDYGGDGLYAYEGSSGNDIKLTITAESGYSFDISSFDVGVSSGSLTIKLTYANNSTTTFTQNGLNTSSFGTLSSISTAINDVKQVELTSSDFGLFQNFDITDVKAIPPAPTVTDAKISISGASGASGVYKIGDTVTATWNNTAAGDNNASITGVTMDFSQFGGGVAVTAANSSDTWTASYTITAGSIDAINRNVSVSATNSGGTTTRADTTNASVDNLAPTVTDAKISISGASGTGGAYKIGDTVTATWNNTAGGDNNADTISGVTVDFSQFGGGSAVSATNSSGTWSATYTITSGAIDGANKNVSITATDNAGNTKSTADTTNANVDNIAPTVTDAKISISGATGDGGAYKIGDTVTATWNNTAGGDNNADTIAGVTVDFSQFGGGSSVSATNSSGTWTATYTIVSGIVNGVANRNIAVSATDDAGNTTTTSDTSNATVDNVAPAITFSGAALSADTGSSSSDFVTSTASQTITAMLSGAPAGGDIVYGSLDNGGTWTDITSKVSGTTLTWNGVTLSGSNTLKLKVTDVAGNDGTVTSQAYTLDTSTPAAPSTPDMTSGTDTGSSTSDNITSTTTPTFAGTAENGGTVTLYDTDGTTVLGTATATGGNWSITSSALSAGSHTVTAKATDAAGNTSAVSSGLSVNVDNAAPAGLGLSATTIASVGATSTSTVAIISATDSQAITYSLAAGNGTNDADNGSFTISGTSLKVGGASLSAGTYKIYLAATDAAGNVANQAFTLTIVDAPSISSIVRTGGASATVNTSASSLSYTVTFSESVTGVDASDFTLTATGTASGSIASVTGSGTTYTVAVDSLAGDGTLRLDLRSSGTGIQNGSSVAIASGYTSGSTYTLDHTAPTAPSTPNMTSGTDTGTSNSDDITSNTTPTFTGTAESGSTVTLYDTDGTTVLGTATATGGNWSITSSALSSGNHTVTAKATDAAGNVSSASSGLAVTVDSNAPTVTSVSVPANGAYSAGQVLSFTVNTSEAVTVDTSGGTPRIALVIGSSTVYANYASGSGSNALVFTYTVQSGDTDVNGITVSALSTNGGTLRDAAGNSMNTTLNSVSSTVSVLVDTTAPTVNSVTVPSNGTYYGNQSLDFTVNFSEDVTVNTTGGTPRIALTLDTGGTVYATYLSGSGTNALVFRHVVANGEEDATGITVGALSANGGTLRDGGGNNANLTLNSVGSTASVTVDANMPQVTGVTSSTANGSYKAGTTISISVDFSKAVTVDTTGGTPTLALNSGGSATYGSGSGSSTLVFTYTVGAGENSADLDYASTGALALNGATIKDSTGSHLDALLTLGAPGTSGSLGNNKAIVIDTVAPAITLSGIALLSDTGASASDFITSATAQTISATLSAGLGAGEKLYGSVDNGGSWTDITSNVSGTALSWTGATLGTGTSALKLKVSDAAGNDGTVMTTAYTVDATAPAFQSASVDGTSLVMRYTESATLDAANAPVAGAFTVTAGNVAVAVNAVAVSAAAKTVTLTLASAVSSGQVVTVAYTDPTGGNDANAIQDQAGNDAATLVATNVTNNTPAQEEPPSAPAAPSGATIDGVSVQTGTVTNSDGTTSTQITIPVVSQTRTEQVGNNTVADIPLVTTTGGVNVLTAQVPTGIGLVVQGPAAPKAAGSALSDLIREIQAHTTSGSTDQNTLTGGGSGFLQDLPSNTPLLVQTIVPAAAPSSAAPTEPLVITGTAPAAGNPLTALVIDMRSLPNSTEIQLQNVEFAAIIGSARVTGGAGSQTVYGDGSEQVIFLGADDDILHGGAGNDTVGSAGGNDQIFGDEGNDLVFGGEGNDVIDGGTGTDTVRLAGAGRSDYTMRVENGKLSIAQRNGGIDGSDTVSNVEKLVFTGVDADMTARGTITRLYDALFDRSPDQQGLDYWVKMSQSGMSTHDIAYQFIVSIEAKTLLGTMSNADFVGSLYQSTLGRAADDAGRAYWNGVLDEGKDDRANVLLAFADSVEKRAQEKANGAMLDFNRTDVAMLIRMYDTLFDRKPDEAGLNYWIAESENGMALRDISASFIQSVEAKPILGNMSNTQFIEYLYVTGLGRQGSNAEVASWAGQLDSGMISRGDALLGFANSAEKIELVGVMSTSIDTI
ncbi:MAG TPA: DUF4347 domain-containing protein [Noviherbaspirillum sp.]|nr:DUF4347 domain-containing protein [Noviherbaspirillum sp.]